MTMSLSRFMPYLFLIAFGVLVYAPLLFFGYAFSGEEQTGFYYVISSYVERSIESGKPMVWIQNYYGGLPASLDQFVSAWYPVNRILFSLFDFFTAHHASIALATIAGLLLSYWFGRLQGWLRSTSLCLAFLYFSATTFSWLWIGTTTAHSFAILPGLLVALQLGHSQKRYALAIVIGSLSLGVGFLAGFMQIVFYDYVVAGLYALFLDWSHFSKEKPLVRNFPSSYLYAAITFGGLAIGFMQVYPSVELIDLTIRTGSYAAQHAITPYPTEFLATLLPPYASIPFFGGGASAGFYLTPLGLIAAILCLLYARSRMVLFFAGTYVLVSAFAWHIPPFGWINEHLPPFSHMGGNFRWIVAASFPIAFIGAAGIQALLQSPERFSRKAHNVIVALIAGLSFAFILGSITLSFIAKYVAQSPTTLQSLITWYTGGRTLAYPPEHYLAVLSNAIADVTHAFSLANPRFFFGVALWVLAGCVFALIFYTARGRTFRTQIVLSYVLVATIGVAILQWTDFVPAAIYRNEPGLIAAMKAREAHSHDYRFMAYIVGDGAFLKLASSTRTVEESASIQMQTLSNNMNLYFDVDRMDGMAPYRTLRHNRLLDTVVGYGEAAFVFDDTSPNLATGALDQLYNRDVQKKSTIEEKLKDFPKRLPLLSMMNVKYVYSPFVLEGVTRIATVPVYKGDTPVFDLYLYENPSVLPRIYAAQARFVMSEREALLGVIATQDFKKESWIECNDCETLPPAKADITIERYDSGVIEFTVTTDKPTWVIVSESTFPGWKATIDGTPTTIYTANYLFQAVKIPEGEHHVALSYSDVAAQLLSSSLNVFHTDQ